MTSKKTSYVSELKNKIRSVFDDSVYEILIGYNSINDITIILNSKEPNTLCGQLQYKPKDNTIHVNMIQKCSTSGTLFLENLDKLAEILQVNEIRLEDKSNIIFICDGKKITIEMPILYILSTGRSWYNSKGYISSDSENEIIHNSEIIQQDMTKFLKDLGYGDIDKEFLSRHNLDSTVKTFFTTVKNYLMVNNDCQLILWLKDLFTKIKRKKTILYGVNLHKEFIYYNGGRRLKTKKPIKQTKKTASK